jgi:hypothetical protein
LYHKSSELRIVKVQKVWSWYEVESRCKFKRLTTKPEALKKKIERKRKEKKKKLQVGQSQHTFLVLKF